MKQLRIAFCGPNLQLNEDLVAFTWKLLDGEEIVELPNPVAQVSEMSRRETFDGHDLDWLNLWSVTTRRMLQSAHRDKPIVVSPTTGIDQCAFQATWMGEQVVKTQSNIALVDAQGNPMVGNDGVMVNRSGAVLQTILNATEEEVVEYWDYIYAILPITPSIAPTAQEIKDHAPGAMEKALLIQYDDFLGQVPAFQKVTRLLDNQELAEKTLRDEAVKWKEKLASS